MARPKTTLVPPNVATLVHPALGGLSSVGTLYLFLACAGYLGTDNTLTDLVNGYYAPAGTNEFRLSIPLLGLVSPVYFYHTSVDAQPVWAWSP